MELVTWNLSPLGSLKTVCKFLQCGKNCHQGSIVDWDQSSSEPDLQVQQHWLSLGRSVRGKVWTLSGSAHAGKKVNDKSLCSQFSNKTTERGDTSSEAGVKSTRKRSRDAASNVYVDTSV